MTVSQKTIDALANRGITIRPTLEDFDAHVKKEWKWSYDYNDSRATEEERRTQADNWIKDLDRIRRRWWDKGTTIYIFEGPAIYEMKNCAKWCETTLEQIEKRIEKEHKLYNGAYGSFCRKMQELLRETQIQQGFSIYPTTYGIGVWVFYNYCAGQCIETVESVMKARGIEYTNEFSDKRWVYRFKVSKKPENMARIDSIINN